MTWTLKARTLGSMIVLSMTAIACSSGGSADGTGSPTGSDSGGQAVKIAGFLYDPSPVTVAVGSTVTWTNEDDILHTVTSGTPDEPGTTPLDGTLDGPGTTYEASFPEAGTFEYFCARHNSMLGTVTVS